MNYIDHRAARRIFFTGAFLLACIFCSVAQADNNIRHWTYADYLQPNNSIAEGIADGIFSPLKKEGIAKVQKFYQESLLKATDILPGVAQGRADLGFTVVLYYPARMPLSQLASVPYIATNGEAVAKAFNELYAESHDFRAEYDKLGVHVITFTPIGGTIIGGTELWRNVADLKGQSIRAAGYVANALEKAGAKPVAITAPEVYESLNRGVIKGYSSYPFDIAIAGSLQEVAPFFMDAGLGQYNLGMLVMTKSKWDKLPENTKKAIQRQVNGSYFPTALEKLHESDAAACKAVTKAGGKAVIWNDKAKRQFKDLLGTSLVDAWKKAAISSGLSSKEVDAFYKDYRATYKKFADQSKFKAGIALCDH